MLPIDPADKEFKPGDDDGDGDDDESHMDEADEPADAAGEVNSLQREGEMSIEELLAMYPGYGAAATDSSVEDDGGGGSDEEEEAKGRGEAEAEECADADDTDAEGRKRSKRVKRSTEGNEDGNDSDTVLVQPSQSSRRQLTKPGSQDTSTPATVSPTTVASSPHSKRRRQDKDASLTSSTASSRRAAKSAADSSDSESNADDNGGSTADLLSEDVGSSAVRSSEHLEATSASVEAIQPTGLDTATTNIRTPVPFLLKGSLRPYQLVGMDWLANMCDRRLNGILADEMGLGKTIQTIALLAHLACEKGNWGPHLVIVPTSVLLNWEMEFKKWCPALKILTYYGTTKERKEKRTGWTKFNTFHVCITSYKLAVQDHTVFKRKRWQYVILDEAHHIKNFESKRWQTLLGFNSRRRLLLMGTPLQNSLMELWSLLHFLMPNVFQSHQQFKEWFGKPVTEMVQGLKEKSREQIQRDQERVQRLHKVLRPFILRRLKNDVEKQMPKKIEHILPCHLSK
jgi:helicase SRCAP